MEEVSKWEVEEMLGVEITEEQFHEALEYAKRKQSHIYKLEQGQEVLQKWYLAILTKEYVLQLAFSQFTQDFCEKLHDMEKECPVIDQNTLTLNHIVAQPTA